MAGLFPAGIEQRVTQPVWPGRVETTVEQPFEQDGVLELGEFIADLEAGNRRGVRFQQQRQQFGIAVLDDRAEELGVPDGGGLLAESLLQLGGVHAIGREPGSVVPQQLLQGLGSIAMVDRGDGEAALAGIDLGIGVGPALQQQFGHLAMISTAGLEQGASFGSTLFGAIGIGSPIEQQSHDVQIASFRRS